jgi:hypothetical protein
MIVQLTICPCLYQRMENYNNKEPAKKLHWNKIEESTNQGDTTRSENWTNPEKIARSKCPICGYVVDQANDIRYEQADASSLDLGEYYIGRMLEAMEERYSKPREEYHVTDVCLCPRQNVFREIDRLPIDAKTVSIYSVGRAIPVAIP